MGLEPSSDQLPIRLPVKYGSSPQSNFLFRSLHLKPSELKFQPGADTNRMGPFSRTVSSAFFAGAKDSSNGNFCITIRYLLFVNVFLSSILGTYAQVDQISILLDIKRSLQDPRNALYNWENFTTNASTSASPCQWNGISCNDAGLVKAITLDNTGLMGSFPSDLCRLGTLQTIQLSHNFLHGSIANVLWSNCSQLEILNLTTNALVGFLPDFSALSPLQVLDLSENSFSGNLTELVVLELSWNSLTGTIPKEITRLAKLTQLELYNNKFVGEIPSGFGNLTSLKNFDASNNFLSGTLSELATLKNLASLHLLNNHISGSIPIEFGEFQFLMDLALYTNNLTGPLPPKLGTMSDFMTLDVSDNGLTGSLPPDVCKRGKLVFFLALQNSFTGEIPKSYGDCLSLVRFRVSNNNLSGRVPSGIWGLPHAYIIDLSYNNFKGEMDREIKKAKNLSVFNIQNNNFSGSIPSEIGQALLLAKFDASNNQFSGYLPNEIGNLSLLSSLLLQKNMLSGPIPISLGLCKNLSQIDLAENKLNGRIPASLGSIQVLNSLNLSNNQLSGPIPNTLSALQLSLLDFSNNRLTGPVPIQLMNLANNNSFSGNNGLCQIQGTSRYLRLCASSSSRSKHHTRILLAGFISAAAVVVLLIGWALNKRNQKTHEESPSWDLKSFHRHTFTVEDILPCLKQENLIGSGGSGKVYRGELSTGEIIAVKQLWINNNNTQLNHMIEAAPPPRNRQFEMEVETLGSIRHKNIVKLYCCLSNRGSDLLVYEYMRNGSLWSRLYEAHTDSILDWQARYKIALGTAQGLTYLHHDCVPAILHRDIKSSNILLDEDLEPCLADFGVAKCLRICGGVDSTAIIAGTHGYIAPEYAYTYKVSEKSDVYSFGVVLMELVTGKRPMEAEYGVNKGIVHWVSRQIATRKGALETLDARISDSCQEDMMKVLKIAVLCTTNLPALRPCMRQVVQMLSEVPFQTKVIVDIGKF
ncbi:hypothetical protein SUGI_0078000 [Cryptomeria japonica]|nr:hypothetical protein SUGI_0078000 [Cryptomeria japonica]